MLNNKALAALILGADEAALTAMANKGLYKRAVKDIDGAEPLYTEDDEGASVSVGGEVCKIKVPLEKSECSCPARGICRHIIAAILLLKSEVPEGSETSLPEVPEPESEPEPPPTQPSAVNEKKGETLSKKDISKIHECAKACLKLLGGIVRRGYVRCDETLPGDLELAAVRCHTLKMADAERMMRDISGRISECTELRASFDSEGFTAALCRCAGYLNSLLRDDITPSMLGVFKRDFDEYDGLLEILPIGMRQVVTGEYQGCIYYFLNMKKNDEYTFLSYSDLRPVFYSEGGKRRGYSATVWDLGTPLKERMHTQMTLMNAKISGGKLSSSSQTKVVTMKKAHLDCSEVRRLIHYDLREVALAVAGGHLSETDSLFFIHPAAVIQNRFDRYSQTLTITIKDDCGNTADISAHYRAEQKAFIALLERIGENMQKNKDKFYTLLVSARIEHGRLILFPIEVYDFITPIERRDFNMPPIDKDSFAGIYSDVYFDIFERTDELCINLVRSGLTSQSGIDKALVSRIKEAGLLTLAKSTDELIKAAESYRHSFDDNCLDVLLKMQKVKRYLTLGNERIGLYAALNAMNNAQCTMHN